MNRELNFTERTLKLAKLLDSPGDEEEEEDFEPDEDENGNGNLNREVIDVVPPMDQRDQEVIVVSSDDEEKNGNPREINLISDDESDDEGDGEDNALLRTDSPPAIRPGGNNNDNNGNPQGDPRMANRTVITIEDDTDDELGDDHDASQTSDNNELWYQTRHAILSSQLSQAELDDYYSRCNKFYSELSEDEQRFLHSQNMRVQITRLRHCSFHPNCLFVAGDKFALSDEGMVACESCYEKLLNTCSIRRETPRDPSSPEYFWGKDGTKVPGSRIPWKVEEEPRLKFDEFASDAFMCPEEKMWRRIVDDQLVDKPQTSIITILRSTVPSLFPIVCMTPECVQTFKNTWTALMGEPGSVEQVGLDRGGWEAMGQQVWDDGASGSGSGAGSSGQMVSNEGASGSGA